MSAAPGPELASGRPKPTEAWTQRFRRLVFGYDLFLSYSRRDGADYALALANELAKRGLSCFLDQWGTPPGEELPEALKAALRRCTMFVLIASEQASNSLNVREEVEEFLATGRTIIPVTFRELRDEDEPGDPATLGTLETAAWFSLLKGMSLTFESNAALATGQPSSKVFDRILNAEGFHTRNKRLRRIFWVVLVSTVLVLAAGGGVAWFLYQQAAEKTRAAERLRRRVDSERLAIESQNNLDLYPHRALILAVEGVRNYSDAGDPRVPSAEQALRKILASTGGIVLRGHTGTVSRITSDAAGRRLVTASYDGTVRVWDLTVMPPLLMKTLRGDGSTIFGADMTPDARWVVAYGRGKSAWLWDLERNSEKPYVLHDELEIDRAGFTPNGRWAATLNRADLTALLWDLKARDPSSRPLVLCGVSAAGLKAGMAKLTEGADPMDVPGGVLVHVAATKDYRWFAAGDHEKDSSLFDALAVPPGTRPVTLTGFAKRIALLAVSPDGHRIAAVEEVSMSPGGDARLWRRDGGERALRPFPLSGNNASIKVIAFSPDGHWLVTAGEDQTARLWNMDEPDPTLKPKLLKGHAGTIWRVAFSADSRWLATGSHGELGNHSGGQQLVQLWDLKPTPRPKGIFETPGPADEPDPLAAPREITGLVQQFAFSPDSSWLAARFNSLLPGPSVASQTANLWRLRTGPIPPDAVSFATGPEQSLILRGHEGQIEDIEFTKDGRWVATAAEDGTVRLWDVRSEIRTAEPSVLPAGPGDVYSVTFTPNGRWLATAAGDAVLWDLASQDPAAKRRTLTRYRGYVPVVALGGQGHWLAAASCNDAKTAWELQIFDLNMERPADHPIRLEGHSGPVSAIQITRDGRRMVTGALDGTVRIWDLTSSPPSVLSVLPGHGDGAPVLAISVNGQWLVTAGGGAKTARLWNLGAQQPADTSITLNGHSAQIRIASFSPDNRWLVTGGDDKTALLWAFSGRPAEPIGKPIVLGPHRGSITALEFSPDSRWLVTHDYRSHEDGLLRSEYPMRLWDLTSATPSSGVHEWVFQSSTARNFAFSPDSRFLITPIAMGDPAFAQSQTPSARGSFEGKAASAVWDLRSRDPLSRPAAVLRVSSGEGGVKFSSDGKWLLTGIDLWDTTGNFSAPEAVALPLIGNQANPQVGYVGFSPDARWAVVAADDRIALHPLRLDDLIRAAGRVAARNLTELEWSHYLPDRPYRKTFELPSDRAYKSP